MDSLPADPSFEPAEKIAPLYTKGKKVVMISHPGCHFCRMAFDQFNPETREYFKTNAIFLTPLNEESFSLHAQVVQEWNSHSEYKHIIVHSDALLPHLPNLKSTPQFYFFNNGELIEKLVGWKPGTETLLVDAIHHLKKN